MKKSIWQKDNIVIGLLLSISFIVIGSVCFWYYQETRNIYAGQELKPQPLPKSLKLDEIRWEQMPENDYTFSSPDKQKTLDYYSSGALTCKSTHTLLVKDARGKTETALFTRQEADPCSGVDWKYTWNDESTLLRITGTSFISHGTQPAYFDFVYDHSKQALYTVN